jgi:hypothetical protein
MNQPKETVHDALRIVLARQGVALEALDTATADVIRVFRGWLLEHASEHRGNAATAETVTLRSLELIFADEVEQLARAIRPERLDICKDPTTSEILSPNPSVPSRRDL